MNFRLRDMPVVPASFQIAPMVDIVLFLLFFFLVTWNFTRSETELEVVVPTATEGKETRRSKGEIILNIKADGRIVLNRKTLAPKELREALTRISTLYPDQAIILRGDENVSYKDIVAVLDICRGAKVWNVAFATNKPEL